MYVNNHRIYCTWASTLTFGTHRLLTTSESPTKPCACSTKWITARAYFKYFCKAADTFRSGKQSEKRLVTSIHIFCVEKGLRVLLGF